MKYVFFLLLYFPLLLIADPPEPPQGKEWVLIFEENFGGDALDHGTWSLGQEWDQNDCHYPNQTTVGGQPLVQVKNGSAWLYAWDKSSGGKPYTGALIKTRQTGSNPALFSFKYGYVETRVKRTATGNGFHMNCYTYGYDPADGSNSIGNHRWPPEIDYAETVSSSSGKNRMWQALHVKINGDKKDYGHWTENIKWTDWTTYGAWWKDSKRVQFYINNERSFSPSTSFLPDIEQYLVLRIGVGGWGAKPDAGTRFPAIQEVDWIRVWQLQDATEVKESRANFPETFQLCPNFPNPFNPATTIRYSLSVPAQVNVNVINMQGKDVANLVRAHQRPGEHSILWNGKTSGGVPAPSGVYLCRLLVEHESGIHSASQKMILMR